MKTSINYKNKKPSKLLNLNAAIQKQFPQPPIKKGLGDHKSSNPKSKQIISFVVPEVIEKGKNKEADIYTSDTKANNFFSPNIRKVRNSKSDSSLGFRFAKSVPSSPLKKSVGFFDLVPNGRIFTIESISPCKKATIKNGGRSAGNSVKDSLDPSITEFVFPLSNGKFSNPSNPASPNTSGFAPSIIISPREENLKPPPPPLQKNKSVPYLPIFSIDDKEIMKAGLGIQFLKELSKQGKFTHVRDFSKYMKDQLKQKQEEEKRKRKMDANQIIKIFNERNSKSNIEVYKKELEQLSAARKQIKRERDGFSSLDRKMDVIRKKNLSSKTQEMELVEATLDFYQNKLALSNEIQSNKEKSLMSTTFEEFMREKNLQFLLSKKYRSPKHEAFYQNQLQRQKELFDRKFKTQFAFHKPEDKGEKLFNKERELFGSTSRKKFFDSSKEDNNSPMLNFYDKDRTLPAILSPMQQNNKFSHFSKNKTQSRFRIASTNVAMKQKNKLENLIDSPFKRKLLKQFNNGTKIENLKKNCSNFLSENKSLSSLIEKKFVEYGKVYQECQESIEQNQIQLMRNMFSFKDLKNYLDNPHLKEEEDKNRINIMESQNSRSQKILQIKTKSKIRHNMGKKP